MRVPLGKWKSCNDARSTRDRAGAAGRFAIMGTCMPWPRRRVRVPSARLPRAGCEHRGGRGRSTRERPRRARLAVAAVHGNTPDQHLPMQQPFAQTSSLSCGHGPAVCACPVFVVKALPSSERVPVPQAVSCMHVAPACIERGSWPGANGVCPCDAQSSGMDAFTMSTNTGPSFVTMECGHATGAATVVSQRTPPAAHTTCGECHANRHDQATRGRVGTAACAAREDAASQRVHARGCCNHGRALHEGGHFRRGVSEARACPNRKASRPRSARATRPKGMVIDGCRVLTSTSTRTSSVRNTSAEARQRKGRRTPCIAGGSARQV